MFSTIFDAGLYRDQTGLALDDRAAERHFTAQGDRQGLDPSPYFSTLWYKSRHPDWAAQGARTALEDFLTRTARGEDRQPHPLIDPGHYRTAYPDLAGLGAQAALHFMIHGDAEARAPSPGFDAGFYRRCYLALEERHPFRHYVTRGRATGHLPRPQPRDAAESRREMRALMAGLARPLLFGLHDAQPAGVPILTLDLAQAVRDRGWQPVFVMLNAGPLAARLRALGPALVLAEGHDMAGLAAGVPPGTPAIVNTAAAAGIAAQLAAAGLPCLLLVHEMPGYLHAEGLMADLRAAQAAGARPIASMPRMATALVPALGPTEQLRPGIVLPATPLAAFRRARHWRGGAGPVFIGAGHADRRKGFDLFLDAGHMIAARRHGARFVWLGALDGWAQDLARAAQAAGLDLALPGFAPDALAWYRAADVYLLTSRQDPGPATAVHAAAMGTPFVGYAADIGLIGLAEAAGRFVPPGDATGFVDAALHLADRPPARRPLRRLVRHETAFAPYVEALLARLTPRPADG